MTMTWSNELPSYDVEEITIDDDGLPDEFRVGAELDEEISLEDEVLLLPDDTLIDETEEELRTDDDIVAELNQALTGVVTNRHPEDHIEAVNMKLRLLHMLSIRTEQELKVLVRFDRGPDTFFSNRCTDREVWDNDHIV